MTCPVAAAARAHPSRLALRFEGTEWTWAQADREVDRVAKSLSTEGPFVRRQSFNTPELAWTFFACGRVGKCFVPINARLTASELERLPTPQGHADALAALYTSGTTGVPNAVLLSRANFEANASASAERLGASPTDVWLGTLPLFHVGGLAMLYRCAVAGSAIELEAGFEVTRVSNALSTRVTHASLVPTMLDRVLEMLPSGGELLQAVLIGGGPMTSDALQRARSKGVPVLQTYGLTEACSQVTTERRGEADGTTAGPAINAVQVRITGADAEGVGEIEVSGPTVALGRGPWLATKDLGRLDARGRLTVFARRTDLVISGGENVYPAEIEGVLREHPLVRDVGVGPRADPEWGQIVVAAVASDASFEELAAFARERLAPFKLPKVWVRVPEVPRNATGKIDRVRLRALVAGS